MPAVLDVPLWFVKDDTTRPCDHDLAATSKHGCLSTLVDPLGSEARQGMETNDE
jgi:hypothetical protein